MTRESPKQGPTSAKNLTVLGARLPKYIKLYV